MHYTRSERNTQRLLLIIAHNWVVNYQIKKTVQVQFSETSVGVLEDTLYHLVPHEYSLVLFLHNRTALSINKILFDLGKLVSIKSSFTL